MTGYQAGLKVNAAAKQVGHTVAGTTRTATTWVRGFVTGLRGPQLREYQAPRGLGSK